MAISVLFAVSAGPRIGFGHLARARALAHAMSVPFVIAVRGTAATRRTARRLGATVVTGGTRALVRLRPDLLVVDDPRSNVAAQWVTQARRHGVPVATVHDLGRGYVRSDLVIDGTLTPKSSKRIAMLAGPKYAILDPSLARRGSVPRIAGRVVISLGGGAHVRRFAASLVTAITRRNPDAVVVVAAGFSRGSRPALPAPARWIDARAFVAELSRASVAVLGGGVTLYEASVLGTPVVALAVTPAQQRTVRAFAQHGAAIDAGLAGTHGFDRRVAASVARLLTFESQSRAIGARAQALVDGKGATRVASRLVALTHQMEESSHAA
jgi:spore coat polysaccharide biosynthesis predicted glycosyltransferase SpsG